ncbi:MAG: hypothetical protein HS108_05945 [Planctomycetes bacterium]|jgi:hypothetical protein|nr:hypothetical protein [Planctomycetota bacterium]
MRLIVPALLLALFAAPAMAQKTALLSTTRDDKGVVTWKLAYSGDIELSQVLDTYADSRAMRVQYDPRKMPGTLRVSVPGNGMELRGEQIDLFVQGMLGEYRMILSGIGTDTGTIVAMAEGSTVARTVDAAALAKANAAEWVNCIYNPVYLDSNSLRGALQNLVSRAGGQIQPTATGGLIISDRCDRVREIYKAAQGMDKPGPYAKVPRRYDLADGIEPADAKRVIEELFSKPEAREASVEVSILGGKRAIIIRARVSDHEQISKALELLK